MLFEADEVNRTAGTRAGGNEMRRQFVFGGSVGFIAWTISWFCTSGATGNEDVHAPDVVQVVKLFEPRSNPRFAVMQGPCINDTGDLACAVNGVSGEGVWLKRLHREWLQVAGDETPLTHVPSTDDLEPTAWRDVVLNAAGDLAFTASLRGQDGPNQVGCSSIWTFSRSDELHFLATANGQNMPTAPFADFHSLHISLADSGKVAVSGQVRDASDSRSVRDATPGIWTAELGGWLTQAVYPADRGYGAIMNDRGDVFYSEDGNRRRRSAATPHKVLAVLTQGVHHTLVRYQDTVDFDGKESRIRGVYYIGVNNDRHIASTVTLDVGENKLARRYCRMSATHAVPVPLFPEGTSLPVGSDNNKMNAFSVINARGDIVNHDRWTLKHEEASLRYAPSSGQARPIAVQNRPAPSLNGYFSWIPEDDPRVRSPMSSRQGRLAPTFLDAVLNARGQVAFLAGVQPADEQAERYLGLFATGRDANDPRLIVKTGDSLTLPNGQTRKIASLFLAGHSGNQDARPSGLNDLGQIVFLARFTDGSCAVVRSDAVANEEVDQQVAQAPQDVEQDLQQHRQEALEALAKWQVEAASQVEKQRVAATKSNATKLRRLADDLSREYATTLDQYQQLADDSSVSVAMRETQLAPLRRRLVRLQQTWNLLTVWPFDEAALVDHEQREFENRTNRLFGRFGEVEEVRDAVAALQKQLSDLAPEPLEFHRLSMTERRRVQHVRRAILGFTGNLSLFSEPIGPDVPKPLDLTTADKDANRPVPDAPLELCRDYISGIVQLEVTAEGRLQLNRDLWSTESDFLSFVALYEQVEEILKKYEVDHDFAFGSVRRDRVFSIADIPGLRPLKQVADRFARIGDGLSDGLGRTGGGGGGSATEQHRRLRSEKLEGNLKVTATTFELRLDEQIPPRRSLAVDENREEGTIIVVLDRRDELLRLQQQADGTVHLISGPIAELSRKSAANFAELRSNEPELVQQELVEHLRQFGINIEEGE